MNKQEMIVLEPGWTVTQFEIENLGSEDAYRFIMRWMELNSIPIPEKQEKKPDELEW